jgi:hypothetical protein
MTVLVLVISINAETNLLRVWFMQDVKETNSAFLRQILVGQDSFDSVAFFDIDTFTVSSTRPWTPEPVFRVAVDNSLRVYKLYGFDVSEFEELCDAHPADVDTSNAREIGKLFIELQKPSVKDSIVFVEDAEQFLSFQHSLSQDKSKFDHPKLSMGYLSKQIRSLFDSTLSRPSASKSDRGYYSVRLVVWYYLSGMLVNYNLRIEENGACTVLKEDTIATDCGYWMNVH